MSETLRLLAQAVNYLIEERDRRLEEKYVGSHDVIDARIDALVRQEPGLVAFTDDTPDGSVQRINRDADGGGYIVKVEARDTGALERYAQADEDRT